MNTRNTTPKERMLKKIRQALLVKRENPYPDFLESSLFKDEEESLDVTFAREFTAQGGGFIYCDGEISLVEDLIRFVEKIKLSNIVVWETSIQKFLDQYGFPYRKGGDSNAMDIGIISCEALIARTGSIVTSSFRTGASLTVFPSVLVVFAKASQLVMDTKHALVQLEERYQDDLPSSISIMTGVSLTKHIEYKTVSGGFGPKSIYLFLIEDRF